MRHIVYRKVLILRGVFSRATFGPFDDVRLVGRWTVDSSAAFLCFPLLLSSPDARPLNCQMIPMRVFDVHDLR